MPNATREFYPTQPAHPAVLRGIQLAKECAHKLATPANWLALEAHLQLMADTTDRTIRSRKTAEDTASRLRYPDTTGGQ